MKQKTLGFWRLGAFLLVGFLLCFARFSVLEQRYQAVKAEHDALGRQMYEVGMGLRSGEEFDWERYRQVDDDYWALRQSVSGKHSPLRGTVIFGLGLMVWFLALIGRGISAAAKWSEQRDEKKRRKKE